MEGFFDVLQEFQVLLGIIAAIIAFLGTQLAAYVQSKTARDNVERQIKDNREKAHEEMIQQQGAFATAIRSACDLLFYHSQITVNVVSEQWFHDLRGDDREAEVKLLKFYVPSVLNSPWRDFILLDAGVHYATAELIRDIVGTNELLDFSRVHTSSELAGLIIDRANAVCTGTTRVRDELATFLKAHPEIKVGFDPGSPPEPPPNQSP